MAALLIQQKDWKLPLLSRLLAFPFFLAAVGWSGCASTPVEQTTPETPRSTLERDFKAYGLRALQEVQEVSIPVASQPFLTYTQTLVERIAAKDDLLQAAAPAVFPIRGFKPAFRVLGIPGTRLFVPVELVTSLQYEAEYAAALALELAHLSLRHYSRQSESVESLALPRPAVSGAGAVFAYDDEQNVAAAERAVILLHEAGYDPRGLVSLLTFLRTRGPDSPFDASLCDRMIEKTRLALSERTPLLNPLVQSPAYRQLKSALRGDSLGDEGSARRRIRR
jgi:predicted Zn-dependent protease